MPYEHPESLFMLFVAISSIFISLFKGHVACWNFCLTGSPYTQLFLHPLPRETRWVLQMSSDTDDRMGAKIKTLKKFPQTPNPPKNPMVDLWALKISRNHITRKIPKKNTRQIFLFEKILESKISTPKNPSIIPALEIWSTPWGPTSIIILFLTIPISIRRKFSGSSKTALIFHQILSCNSLRKCQEINVENLCINVRANVLSVCLFVCFFLAKLTK